MPLKLTEILQFPSMKELLHSAEMLLNLSITELVELIYEAIKKVTVMRHYHESAVICLKSLFENILRTDIHMVGRLIKSKQIIWLEHELSHSQTGTLSTAQHCYLLINILSLEKKSTKDITKLQTNITDSYSVQCAEYRIIFIKYIFLILSVVSYIYIMTDLRLTVHRVQFFHYHTHQRSLTLSVSTYEGDLLTSSYLDLSPVKDHLGAITNTQIHTLVSNIARTWSWRELHTQS